MPKFPAVDIATRFATALASKATRAPAPSTYQPHCLFDVVFLNATIGLILPSIATIRFEAPPSKTGEPVPIPTLPAAEMSRLLVGAPGRIRNGSLLPVVR